MRQTGKYLLSIDRKEICYLQWIIESYDGMASMRTINPINGEIEISIVPGCKEDIVSLIESLQEEGSIHVNKKNYIDGINFSLP
jgi:hypothetical protein